MASTGLYDDGRNGIRRLTDPELRLTDQERDGVQAEVLYGVLGASMRLNDSEAATEMLRIYNEWLVDFCATHPDRYAGLASIPSHNIDAAVEEARRVAKTGVLRGLDIANRPDLQPFWDPCWEPLWVVADEAKLPIHLHTIGGSLPDLSKLAPKVGRAAFATMISSFQMYMALPLMAVIFAGVLERHPGMRMVIGESGIGWLPYVLDHMDLEWEDQFHDLDLKMKPSDYWRRQCYATYQSDRIGIKMLDEIGEDNIMWGSDFPHPDGIWPDSQDYIRRELGHLPAARRHKIVCANAAALYGFSP
jgi:predicted TIM-barrel fold metal-dependent hydrolase